MSDTTGFALAQARVMELQARLGVASRPRETSSTSGTDFSQVLARVQEGDNSNITGEQIIEGAKKYLGIPYKWGGTDPRVGLDCSGFVQRVYKDAGIDLPRVAADQAKAGKEIFSLADARPGDLVAFDNTRSRAGIDHIGIYVGNGEMIVAPKTGDVIKVQKITSAPAAIRRILPEDGLLDLTNPQNLSRVSANGSPFGITGLPHTGNPDAAGGYGNLFLAAGRKYGVDPNLLAAVGKAESNFNPNAVSHAGAQGMMQFMPATARGLGINPLNPVEAVDGAARLLLGHMRRFGSVDLALAAYNAGGGAVAKYGGIPPYKETQNYVRRVNEYLRQQLVSGANQ